MVFNTADWVVWDVGFGEKHDADSGKCDETAPVYLGLLSKVVSGNRFWVSFGVVLFLRRVEIGVGFVSGVLTMTCSGTNNTTAVRGVGRVVVLNRH